MSSPSTFKSVATAFADRIASNPLIRAVNFHNTPRARTAEYDKQLEGLSRAFSPVTEPDLDDYLATGRWTKPKPGVILSVYEGYRNGFDVFLPLLERHGLIGWFFIITGFVKAAPSDQLTFATNHGIDMETREYDDGRYAMSWNEIRQAARNHVIASHTRSHVSLATLDLTQRESEIVGAQKDFEENLGRPVRAFASYGGPPYGEDAVTDRLIDRAGYQFLFSNLKIQRLREWAGT